MCLGELCSRDSDALGLSIRELSLLADNRLQSEADQLSNSASQSRYAESVQSTLARAR